MEFKNEKHRERFTEFVKANIAKPYRIRYEYMAALFLLSANAKLWVQMKNGITPNSVDFSESVQTSADGYTLYRTAKEIYNSSDEGITVSELCDDELVSDEIFGVIITGLEICRNGIFDLYLEEAD